MCESKKAFRTSLVFVIMVMMNLVSLPFVDEYTNTLLYY